MLFLFPLDLIHDVSVCISNYTSLLIIQRTRYQSNLMWQENNEYLVIILTDKDVA